MAFTLSLTPTFINRAWMRHCYSWVSPTQNSAMFRHFGSYQYHDTLSIRRYNINLVLSCPITCLVYLEIKSDIFFWILALKLSLSQEFLWRTLLQKGQIVPPSRNNNNLKVTINSCGCNGHYIDIFSHWIFTLLGAWTLDLWV